MIWPAVSPCPASVTPMVSRSARFAWLTALTGSCSYVVSAIKCARCSVIAMGRSSQGCAVGVEICTSFGLASVGLGRLLVFKLLFSRVNSLPWRSRSFLLRSCHGPLLGEPGRRRLSRTTHGQLTVLVAPALGEACERARHLEINLQAVAVRVEEVDAALVHVIHRAVDPYAVFEQRAVRLSQRFVVGHLKGDVGDAERPGWTSGSFRAFVRRHVQGVEVLPQRHEQVAVLGILLGNPEAEHVTVKRF